MEREKVLELMLQSKVVPLFYEGDQATARKLVDACYAGGARVIEFTNRGEGAVEVFRDLIGYSAEHYPDLALGIGSIANSAQAEEFIELGAHFLVSPFLDQGVADTCARHGKLWSGGCATLTEMHTAHGWGVPLMKIFPGNILGPAFVKAAKAPCPYFKVMVTGGVKPTEENLNAWFKAGASCVGMGSQLFVKGDDGDFDYEQIQHLLSKSIGIAQAAI